MGIPSFTQGYPQDGSSLGSSKSVIRDNLDGTFQVFSVDHQDQNESNPGYHSVIHLPFQGSAPSGFANGVQVFSQASTIPGGYQLFVQTSTGNNLQISGSIRATSGFAWCCGVLFQWGFVSTNFATNTGLVTFATANQTFPTACFNVQLTFTGNSSSAQTIQVTSSDRFGFNWKTTNGSATSYTGFYWFATGN